MTQGERVKEVRRTQRLTLEKFGERLGVKKNSVSQIENGHNRLTDQMAKAICREFGVSESWLRTGEGEMIEPTTPSEYLLAYVARISTEPDSTRPMTSVVSPARRIYAPRGRVTVDACTQ